MLIMPAWNAAGLLGIKTINIYPHNGARGLPGLHATYMPRAQPVDGSPW